MRALPFALLATILLLPIAAEAGGRRPQEFKARELTEEEQMIKAARGKNQLDSYAEDAPPEPERPFPWLFIGFATLLVAGTIPFAVRAYRGTSNELRDVEAARGPQPRKRRPPSPTS